MISLSVFHLNMKPMKKLIILCVYSVCVPIILTSSLLGNPNIWEEESEELMQSAGYPKTGDIPILNRKIFKGQRVGIREHPYVASIRRRISHYLTGALLTKNLVITVAHPLHEVPVTELNIVLGENYSDRGAVVLTVLLVIVHEKFDLYTLKNDIAMLRFYEDVNYKGNIKPISLVAPSLQLPKQRVFVTGWGRCDNMGTEVCLDRTSKYYPKEKMDPMLRTVSFDANLPNYYCEGYKRHEVTLFPGMLCTGVAREEDQVCPCLGAPGALLVLKARLLGVLSWGFGCGYSYDLPLIYSDMQYFSSWIAHNIKILRNIKKNNLTEIFMANKAAILSEWLIETRIITPALKIRMDKNLEALSIDPEITKLRGKIYDVRDYIVNGMFRKEKMVLYQNLRRGNENLQPTENTTRVSLKLKAFIGNKTLSQIGFNTSNIVSNAFVKTTTADEETKLNGLLDVPEVIMDYD